MWRTIFHFVVEKTKLAFDGVDSWLEFLANDSDPSGTFFAILRFLDLKLNQIAALEKVLLVKQTGDAKLISRLIAFDWNHKDNQQNVKSYSQSNLNVFAYFQCLVWRGQHTGLDQDWHSSADEWRFRPGSRLQQDILRWCLSSAPWHSRPISCRTMESFRSAWTGPHGQDPKHQHLHQNDWEK